MARRRARPQRRRIGSVSLFLHHGAWWISYSNKLEGERLVRRRVGKSEEEAAIVAAQVNAQLAADAPTLFSFKPVSCADLQQRFVAFHADIQRTSLATVRRYRTATLHLAQFSAVRGDSRKAHEIDVEEFVRYLRALKIAPNGHPHTKKRRLRDKGIQYILQTCRSMYSYAAKKRLLPPYFENPFSNLAGRRFRIEDAKPIFVFDQATEVQFLRACDPWAFPIQFTLAKTGARPGEIAHLLIEDVELDGGWLRIREKPELGWRVKTRQERAIPMVPELVAVLRRTIGDRRHGPLFLRQRYRPNNESLSQATRVQLAAEVKRRVAAKESQENAVLSRERIASICHAVWQAAGAVRVDRIRTAFIQVAQSLGLEDVTCPKSWRHSFATLLLEARVDPLIRQLVLGHAPSNFGEGALGMTTRYSHPTEELIKSEVLRALQLRTPSLRVAGEYSQKGESQPRLGVPVCATLAGDCELSCCAIEIELQTNAKLPQGGDKCN